MYNKNPIELIPYKKRYHGGAPQKQYLSITNKFLIEYLNISIRTLYRWIKSGKLNPTDIESIVQLKQRLTK